MRRFLGRLGNLIGRGLVSRGLGGPAATAPVSTNPAAVDIHDGYCTSVVVADDYACVVTATFGYTTDVTLTTAPQ